MIVSLATVTVVVVVLIAVSMSPLLDVEEIQVVGAANERIAAVERAAGIERGDSIVTMLPGRIAGNVSDLPWIDSVSVTRDFPTTVQIRVTERLPVGWLRTGSRVLVVDDEARVLWQADVPVAGLPELVGAADVARPGGRIRPVVLAAAAGALGPDLRARTATATLSDGTLMVQVVDGPQLRFGAPSRLAAKARVAAAVLDALAGPATFVDVTVPAAPVSG